MRTNETLGYVFLYLSVRQPKKRELQDREFDRSCAHLCAPHMYIGTGLQFDCIYICLASAKSCLLPYVHRPVCILFENPCATLCVGVLFGVDCHMIDS
jgi:hypothetical protein